MECLASFRTLITLRTLKTTRASPPLFSAVINCMKNGRTVTKSIQFMAVLMKRILSGQQMNLAMSSMVKNMIQTVSIIKKVVFWLFGSFESMAFLISGIVSTIKRATARVIAKTSRIAQTRAALEESGSSKKSQHFRKKVLSSSEIESLSSSSMFSTYLKKETYAMCHCYETEV